MTARAHLLVVVRVAGRFVLWALVLVLLVRGALDTFSGVAPAAGELVRAKQPPAEVGEREASAFAASFARAYLTFSPAHPERHAEALRPYSSTWLGEHAGLELPTGGGQQQVVDVEPARVIRVDRSQILVTVSVQLSPLRPAPIYLTVPVSGSATGALAVVDYPSFSAPPRRAALPEPHPRPLDDDARAQIEDLLRRFFPAYLSGHSDELAYFLPAGRTLEALRSPYTFVQLVSVEAGAAKRAKQRVVLARIRVRDDQTRATYLLRYRVELKRGERWYVAAINTI
jgi:hypothetical protein